MAEAEIRRPGGECDVLRVLYGIRQFAQWYKGDGMYGDGQNFHMDHYNSFVIHPTLADIAKEFADVHTEARKAVEWTERNAVRYAVILEHPILPEGTSPCFFRSACRKATRSGPPPTLRGRPLPSQTK